MKIFKDTLDFMVSGESAVTLGKFDGIHRGHQKLMKKILEKKEDGLQSLVFTFGKMPGTVFLGARGQTILTETEREERLSDMGIDYLIECPFVDKIIHMEPEDFVEQILVKRLHVRYIAVGTDFRFGYQRRGDYRLLKALSETYDFIVEVVEKERYECREISSTYVREELKRGRMEKVTRLLGYSYYVSGVVVHGHQIGRTLGLPTTNILPDEEKMLPPNGVYLTKSIFGDREYFGITNIGVKPTISGEERKGVETYLFDFEGDLYDRKAVVKFYAYERPEQRFDSLEELKNRICQDIEWGRTLLKTGRF
ncbi:MAG: bifunctional riboflavin kinase/FAD synthetase [Lachnospiraceae bacterium]